MNTTIKRLTALAALASIGLFTTVSLGVAQERYRQPSESNRRVTRPHYEVDGQLVDVRVRVSGETAPLYFRPGASDRHYFQAFKGRNYSIDLRNTTNRRVGVVITVDGLNVINGEQSELSHNESMYVLDPNETTTITGWRTSLRNVRKFVFVDEERSYAERTGQANEDMGWIRVASFEERGGGWRQSTGRVRIEDDARRDMNESEGRAMAPEAAPGTGWGEEKIDPVRRTEFRAERSATDRITLRYEYASGLRALGIFPSRSRVWEREGQYGFSKPPRW
jgi:hypothetical protein